MSIFMNIKFFKFLLQVYETKHNYKITKLIITIISDAAHFTDNFKGFS